MRFRTEEREVMLLLEQFLQFSASRMPTFAKAARPTIEHERNTSEMLRPRNL
jgi:hypothetical protein